MYLNELSGRMCIMAEFLYQIFLLSDHKRTRSYTSGTGLFVLKELRIVFQML
jgi:hypothetical protein